MPDSGQRLINPDHPIHALAQIISPLRLGTYLNAAGHDADRALQMYLWNARIGEAFHIPIQSVEVGFRNRTSDGLAAAFGPNWWESAAFAAAVEQRRLDDIEMVKRRLLSKGKTIATGQIIAGLSFGFWVAMLEKRYHPRIWSGQLRIAFPHLPPNINHKTLHGEVGQIADLRNRIWHHEPIFYRNLTGDYARCLRILNWLCPNKAAWIKHHCRIMQVARERP